MVWIRQPLAGGPTCFTMLNLFQSCRYLVQLGMEVESLFFHLAAAAFWCLSTEREEGWSASVGFCDTPSTAVTDTSCWQWLHSLAVPKPVWQSWDALDTARCVQYEVYGAVLLTGLCPAVTWVSGSPGSKNPLWLRPELQQKCSLLWGLFRSMCTFLHHGCFSLTSICEQVHNVPCSPVGGIGNVVQDKRKVSLCIALPVCCALLQVMAWFCELATAQSSAQSGVLLLVCF